MPAILANSSVYVPQITEDIVPILGSFVSFAYPSVDGTLLTALSLSPVSCSVFLSILLQIKVLYPTPYSLTICATSIHYPGTTSLILLLMSLL